MALISTSLARSQLQRFAQRNTSFLCAELLAKGYAAGLGQVRVFDSNRPFGVTGALGHIVRVPSDHALGAHSAIAAEGPFSHCW
jgi:hypothetical protein